MGGDSPAVPAGSRHETATPLTEGLPAASTGEQKPTARPKVQHSKAVGIRRLPKRHHLHVRADAHVEVLIKYDPREGAVLVTIVAQDASGGRQTTREPP